MKRCAIVPSLIFVFVLLSPSLGISRAFEGVETKVVRVLATKKAPYYHKPWKSPNFESIMASGFFFKDEKNFPGMEGLILTNAHAVTMAESVRISNGKEKRRYEAKLVGVFDSADFAVLQLEPEDLKMYERRNGKIEPLTFGDSDALRPGDKVLGWGYPLGGDAISKSEEGEVNRIEINRYAYSQEQWLMVQTSLQQNRGNSGGPVLKDGKVVGIAFQGMKDADRINYFIPINLVKFILPTVARKEKLSRWRYAVQHLFPRLKEYYGLDKEQGGILLDFIIPDGGPYTFGLRAGDIITDIDDHEIDNFGEVYFKPLGQKIFFGEILNRKRLGDPLTVRVIRDGKPLTITGVITPGLPRLVPKIFTKANYFVHGGVGFVELTYNCIVNLGKSGEAFRAKYEDEFPQKPHEKIVIISEIFPEYGLTSAAPFLKRVKKVDGKDVLNVERLYAMIQDLKREGRKKVLLELTGNLRLPLDIAGADELDRKIREKYGILYMKTPDGFAP
jgi:S1-C subfamily serine protease